MSRKAQSGLGSIQRDFSDAKMSSSQELASIYWPPTPPQPKKLSGNEQRLKDIEMALAGLPVAGESKPLTGSRTFNKRSSSEMMDLTDEAEPVTKKTRNLPSTWNKPTLTKAPVSSSTRARPVIQTVDSSAPGRKKVPSTHLSTEQKAILELVLDEKSVFYTGSAGTGKSVLLREIISKLKKKYAKTPDVIAITASTGMAACNIGGVTIHSFGGIGLGTESADELAKKVKKNKKAASRWLRTKVLIIDEISMVDGDLFDKLSAIGKKIRGKLAPFGGIQLVVTGDFFQLPPVSKSDVKFAFEAKEWTAAVPHSFNLTKVFRQRDEEFVDMLNEMRFGCLSQKSIQKFKSLAREPHYEDGLIPTELFPRREDVDRSNSTRLSQLDTESMTFNAIDSGTLDGPQRDKVLNNFMAPRCLVLRIDSQVMLIKNMDETLVNGSIGRVVRFDRAVAAGDVPGSSKKTSQTEKPELYPVVEFLTPAGTKAVTLVREQFKVELPNGEVQASRTQLPLILAWAMSIHKSQGQTLERVKVDLGKVFEKGQAYVALSRATSLQGLQVLNFDPKKVMAHSKVVEWTRDLKVIKDKEDQDRE